MPETKRRVYALEGIKPEVRAVTFAKCSRSPESFEDIARELTEEKSAKFHEKWVVGYGHSSVAEHAILSIAMENVSILATKVIEDNRLVSYTEKSTRYQIFDRHRYYKPAKVMKSSLGKLYEETGNFLFDTYERLCPQVNAFVKKKNPCKPETSPKVYETTCKAKTCDIIRYILPIATQTNLGMTINARNLEHAIRKLLSHPLDEMKEIGQEIKSVAVQVTPTLVKYADYNEYLVKIPEYLEEKSKDTLSYIKEADGQSVTLVDYDKEAEDKIITALLYRGNNKLSARQIKEKVKTLTPEQKEKILETAFKDMGEHNWPIRELEHAYYTFDILIDYGAFRDIQRHRICTQTNQPATCDHGYAMPEEINELGLSEEYQECMEKAAGAFYKIREKFPVEAEYITPLAYKKRVLMTANFREWWHFIKLRSGKRGHISYRRVAQEIYYEIKKVHPRLAKYLIVDMS